LSASDWENASLGFSQEVGGQKEWDRASLLQQVRTDDVLGYGMIPEFVGRLPVVCSLAPLDEEGLVRVLGEPRNALVKQYQTLFEMENSELHFTEDALRAIARRAMEKGVGARGLRSIVEELMLDIMYDLPDQDQGHSYTISGPVVEGREPLFKMPKTKSA
jgi:ATP-dependent Clp protease ATP-binding subunit ClpX